MSKIYTVRGEKYKLTDRESVYLSGKPYTLYAIFKEEIEKSISKLGSDISACWVFSGTLKVAKGQTIKDAIAEQI